MHDDPLLSIEGRFFLSVMRYPKTFVTALVIVTILAALGLPKLNVAADMNLLIPRDEVYADALELRERFDIRDYVIIGVTADDSVFRMDVFEYLKSAADEIAMIDGIERVRSLFSEDNISNDDDGVLIIDSFLSDLSEASVAEVSRAVREFPTVQGILASSDLSALMLLPELSPEADKTRVCAEIQAILDDAEPPAGVEIHLSGLPVFEGTLGNYIIDDLVMMLPLVILSTAILLFLAYRSVILVALALVEVTVVDIWTVGLMGHLGIPFHMIHATLPIILMALAVADEVHIYSKYAELRARGEGLHEAILGAMVHMWRPVVLTSLTTAAGFLGFVATPSAPLQHYGLFTALGTLFAMVFSLTITPIVLSRFGGLRRLETIRTLDGGIFASAGHAIFARRRFISIVVVFLVVCSGLGIARLEAQDDWIGNFRKSSEVRKSNEVLNEKFLGTRVLEIELDTGATNGILDPEFFDGLVAFQSDVDACVTVGGTRSLAQLIQKMNKEFSGNYAIPDSSAALAQYMLLLDGSSYNNYWDLDYRRLRVTVFSQRGDYQSGHILYPAIDAALERHLPEVDIKYGGDFSLGFHWVDIAGTNQMKSLSTSLFFILLSGWLLLRSLRKSIVVVLPILFAILAHFGFMGWLGLPYTISASLSSSMILGVGVDFAIHLQNAFYESRKTMPPRDALAQAFTSSGRAILWTALIIAVSFLILVFSNMPPTQQLGLMVSLGIFSSGVSSFLVVPLFLKWGRNVAA